MSSKINPMTKIVLILTLIGFVIPTIYLNVFSESFLLYHGLSRSGTITISGVLCILGFIGGIAGIFNKKSVYKDRVICLVSTSLCITFLLYAISQFETTTEKARRINCFSDLKQVYLALQQYAIDYAGNYPPPNGATGLEILRKNDYLTDCNLYTCPSVTTRIGCQDTYPLTEELVDYVYIGGLNNKSDRKLPLMYDKTKNHGNYYGNVLFVDGTIKGIEGNPWTQNIKK